MNKFKLIDLFAGAGGLSSGFLQTGNFEVIGAVELNKEARETYVLNHGGNENLIITSPETKTSDISLIDFRKYSDSETLYNEDLVVIGGPPCQGFSNANRQKNYLISGNNQLVKEFARVINETKPVAFLMENVKTMNSKTHKFFVTKHIPNTIYEYSSLEHLRKIAENKKPFWQEDELVLLETRHNKHKELIQTLINFCNEGSKIVLLNDSDLSRMRSLIKKLKKGNVARLSGKEVFETKRLISNIQIIGESEDGVFLDSNLVDLISKTVSILKKIITEEGYNNFQAIDVLESFIEINQLLRYQKELKDENILVTDEVFLSVSDVCKVTVKVLSYNIVKYLQCFFDYMGYNMTSGVVNSKDFFVPQKRQRFILMGIVKDKSINTQLELPQPKTNNAFTVADAIKDLELVVPSKNVSDDEKIYKVKNALTKMQDYYRNGMDKDLIYNHVNTDSEPLSKKRFQELSAIGGRNFHSLSDELKNISYTDSSRTQNTVYLKLSYEEPAPTVVNVRKSMWQHPKNIEALSIREAARLQSFKDNYKFVGSKDKQYQQIGNAVPPLLARAIAESMLLQMGVKPKKMLIKEF